MTAAIKAICGVLTGAITGFVILVIVLSIIGIVFVAWGIDSRNFEVKDVSEWLKIIFKKKDADAGSGRRGW